MIVTVVSVVVSLEEDSVEVARLEVLVLTAPAGRSLQVDHNLLQLLLNHTDPGSYCKEHYQAANITSSNSFISKLKLKLTLLR